MNELIQTTFDYSLITEEQASQLKVIYNRVLIRHMSTAYEDGKDLLEAKNTKGLSYEAFMSWAQSSYGWSENTITLRMNIALRWGPFTEESSVNGLIGKFAMGLLSSKDVPESARQEAKELLASGESVSTEMAKQIRDAHKAKARAEEEAEEERQIRFQWQSKAEEYTQQIAELQDQIEMMEEPKEVEKIVPSPSDKAEIERLQKKVREITEKRDNLSKENEALADFVREQTVEQKAREYEESVRKNWRAICTTFNQSVLKTFSQWPSPIDAQYFESDDWAYLSQVKETVQRFLHECSQLTEDQGLIIDAVETQSIP